MQKTILLTGATDGIGFETAKMLVEQGHHVILHGRNPEKLKSVEAKLAGISTDAKIETIVADLSSIKATDGMVREIAERFGKINVLINNAGVYNTPVTRTEDDLDVRFAVNTIMPYLLTKELLPLFCSEGRVVNLSSAAQAPVSLEALAGNKPLGSGEAYAQSKLAITMWSRLMGLENKQNGPMVVSVNPKSLLGSKMVKEAYGIAGGDITLGADILIRAALSEEFANAHGKYFDNDIEAFADPYPDALNDQKAQAVVDAIEAVIVAKR